MKRHYWALFLAMSLALAVPALGDSDDAEKGAKFENWVKNKIASYQARGWNGLEMKRLEKKKGYFSKVTHVATGSPAALAGVRKGDVLLAVNGVKLTEDNLTALKSAKKKMWVGSEMTYLFSRKEGEEWSKQKVTLTMAKVPQDVLAKWVGRTILKKFDSAQMAKK